MAIERILGTDTGKAAFEKADRNFVGHEGQINNFIAKGYVNTIGVSDFNNATENGKYTGYAISNAPTTNSTVNVEVIKEASGVVSQIAVVVFGFGAGNAYTRIKQINGIWTAWQKIATDKQPDWITATLQNGWTGNAYYRKNSLEQMEIMFNPITACTVSDFTTIATLPVGYTPLTHSPIVCYNTANGESVNGIVILNSGEIKIRTPATTKIATGQNLTAHSFY